MTTEQPTNPEPTESSDAESLAETKAFPAEAPAETGETERIPDSVIDAASSREPVFANSASPTDAAPTTDPTPTVAIDPTPAADQAPPTDSAPTSVPASSTGPAPAFGSPIPSPAYTQPTSAIPAANTGRRRRPASLGTIVWSVILLGAISFASYRAFSPGTVDANLWLIASLIGVGVLLLAAGIASALRR